MTESLLTLYTSRLSNLTTLISSVHSIVGVDECLSLLNDEKLIKYKMDRINQLIRQVFESEKQKIIIQLINQLDKLQHISNGKIQKQQEQYFKKIISEKNNEAQTARLEIKLLIKQRQEEKKIYNEQKVQFGLYKEKYQSIEEQYYTIMEQHSAEVQHYRSRNQDIASKCRQLEKKNGQNQEEIRQLKMENENIQQFLQKQSKTNKNLVSKSKLYEFQSTRQKLQKVEAMKSQIKKLNLGLSEMKEMFKIIKQNIVRSIATSLKGIKLQLKQLKEYVSRQISSLVASNIAAVREIVGQVVLKKVEEEQSEMLMKKMHNLQGQLDKFIENKLIA